MDKLRLNELQRISAGQGTVPRLNIHEFDLDGDGKPDIQIDTVGNDSVLPGVLLPDAGFAVVGICVSAAYEAPAFDPRHLL